MPKKTSSGMPSNNPLKPAAIGHSLLKAVGTLMPGSHQHRVSSLIVAAGILLAAFYLVNPHIFSQEIIQLSDHAVNSIQIYEAKHLRELHGNYSQFGFHHPGPALFYLLAAGELLFHDIFPLTPAPFNSHCLTIILLNVLALYFSIRIAAGFVRNPYFPAAALAAALAIAGIINRDSGTSYNSAFVSLWVPHTLLIVAILLAVSCSAVAAGRISALPALVVSASLLTHLHVAQIQYTAIASSAAILTYVFYQNAGRPMRDLWPENRRIILLSLTIVGVFVVPLLIEPLFYQPSNIEYILRYMKANFGRHHTFASAFQFIVNFAMFTPETLNQAENSLLRALSEGVLRFYFGAVFLLATLGIALRGANWRDIPFFFRYLAVHCAIVLLLFLNWATTATGPLLPYHGYFLFGLHVIALWLLLAIVFDAFHPDPLSAFPKVCMLAAPALVFPLATSFRMPTPDVPLIREAFAALRPHLTERTELEIYASAPSANSHWPFAGGSSVWPITAGLANEIHRSGKRFCVHPDWVMMFGPANICPPDSPLPKVAYLPPTAVVSEPCKELYLHQHIKLVLIPSPDDDLPMKVGPSDCRDSKTGFHANEGVHRWTSKLSTISFPLTAGQLATLAHAELNIKGGLHKGPLLIFVNNTKVGEISEPGDPADGRFPIPEGVLRAGQKNQVRLEAPSATGMSGDTREMGYLFRGLEIKRTPAK